MRLHNQTFEDAIKGGDNEGDVSIQTTIRFDPVLGPDGEPILKAPGCDIAGCGDRVCIVAPCRTNSNANKTIFVVKATDTATGEKGSVEVLVGPTEHDGVVRVTRETEGGNRTNVLTAPGAFEDESGTSEGSTCKVTAAVDGEGGGTGLRKRAARDDTAPFWSEVRLVLAQLAAVAKNCLLYTTPSPRDGLLSRMPSSA